MTELHWQIQNVFSHHAGHGLRMLGFDPKYKDRLPYVFDEHAAELTFTALVNDLPYRLSTDGITFSELYRQICNETPATAGMIKETLIELSAYREVEIITNSGNARRAAKGIKDTDIIRLRPQSSFAFMKGSLRY